MESNIIKAVEELDEYLVLHLVETELEQGADPLFLLEQVKVGMEQVGKLYENNTYFIADLIMAGIIYKEVLGLDKIASYFARQNCVKIGKVVLGTVKGDVHDIGKDIFKSLMEAAGFEVIDLGVDVPKEVFVKRVREAKPDILGLSGILTFTVKTMKEIVDSLNGEGLKDNLLVILGGNHLTKEALEYTGADYCTNDASDGVTYCRDWMEKIRRARS